MARDNVEVPVILEKCCAAVERYGLTLQGIYRVSGTMTKVSKLKDRLDRGPSPFAICGASPTAC